MLLTLVLIFLALSAYKSVLRVSSNDPLAGLAWAIMTVRQLPPRESYIIKSFKSASKGLLPTHSTK